VTEKRELDAETADFATMLSFVVVTHRVNWHGAPPEMNSDSGTEFSPLFLFGACRSS